MTTTIDNKKVDEFLSSNIATPEPGTSKNNETASDSALSDCDYDQVSSPVFSKLNQKLPYTYQEDKEIIKYILKDQNIFKVCSLSLWKHLEAKKDNPKRTYHSLKNRFLRNIKPNLFTSYKHLIDDQKTVKKILIKFPELKKQLRGRKFLSTLNVLEPERNSNSNQAKLNAVNAEKVQTTFTECFDPSILASSIPEYLKTRRDKRTVKIKEDKIKISINLNEATDRLQPILPKLSERFKEWERSNEQEKCLACGRLYNHPLSQSSDCSEIPNSYPLETDEYPCKLIESNRSGLTGSDSQSLLSCMEKPDKSDGGTEALNNNLPTEVTHEVDMIRLDNSESLVKDQKITNRDSDSGSDLKLYDDAKVRFEKLIDGDKLKTLPKCMKDIDSTIFDEEESLDSLSLETPPGTPI